MTIWRWRPKRRTAAGTIDIESIRHEIRNAIAGIEYQRRQFLKAMSQATRSYLAMDEHLKRIENAIREPQEND